MTTTSFNCQMDITFQHTPDGRPELYDFLWEHLPQLAQTLGEKKICVTVNAPSPVEKWAKQSSMTRGELEHVLDKVFRDKRMEVAAHSKEKSSVLEATIRSEDLDQVLNAYNIYMEKWLPFLTFEGKNFRIDFSSAEKNMVKCFAQSDKKPLINTFLVRNLKQAPRVRSIVFASREERMKTSRSR